MTTETVKNKADISEPAQFGGNQLASSRIWQLLDGRPVGIYRNTGDLIPVSRDQIIDMVSTVLDGYELMQKSQEQVNRLGNKVTEWVTSRQTQVAGFIGAWRIPESNGTDGMPMIKMIFIIAQSAQEEVDEALWLDIARFDVQIAKLPEFANMRVNFIPVPFMTQEQMAEYLHTKCEY
jgi:hypothetical protein